LSDGTFTEVQSEDLTAGTPVVVGEQQAGTGSAASYTSPFAPQFGRGGAGPRR
jgi:hypothetical protein